MNEQANKQDDLSREEKAVLREMAKSDKDNTIFTSYLETDRFILEQLGPATHATRATNATDTKFIFYDKQTASIDYLTSFEHDGREYHPIVDDLLLNGVISLPSGIEEYGDTATLIADIHGFLHENFEVPVFYDKFLPYIVLFSWVYERFPFVPYLHFVGLSSVWLARGREPYF